MPSLNVVASDLGFTEGPVWTADGRLLVTSISHGVIYVVDGDTTSVLAETGGGPNGMAEAADGTLYLTQNGGLYGIGDKSSNQATPGIQSIVGDSVRYLAEGLDAPNDCCFGPDGRLYFTDPRGSAELTNQQPGRVYAMATDGAPVLLAEGPAFTNGIGFGPDPSLLYVSETSGQRVLVYPMRDGDLGEPREFCRTDPGFPDGFCFDVNGRLYVATTLGAQIQLIDTDGRCIDRLECGEGSMPTNCCFGGPDGKTLFVTESQGGRVLSFDLDVQGLPLFPFR
ncbi:MAG: SMP-30/gluconolactonase/LRE family protein [Chloroflexi bacterium]|nr:SMP-30/gluconolactonase/LRE family protein [Chloroflexota bacterium]